MDSLTVLFDPGCGLCRRARLWLAKQPHYVRLDFVPAASARARELFPALDANATLEDLTVIGSTGAVYRGAKAWLMVLWALRKYRSWALTLGTPTLLPKARRLIDWVSRQRR